MSSVVPTCICSRNCVEVYSYWPHWPCLFPQHGSGKKHEREIALTDWQLDLVERWPQQLVRGLIHSDSCRFQNTGTNWTWPRYSFDNRSDEIRAIFCHGCDLLGVRWLASGKHNLRLTQGRCGHTGQLHRAEAIATP